VSAPVQEFVLRCGTLYLGYKKASRVVSIDRAVRFTSRGAAERCALEMQGDGIFRMPWEVIPVLKGVAA
jgi:hypothetical protein